ncbi:MAG: hypothetical protein HQK66_04945, partial [Desulfamplus sp.]|nr:hypothetical protein [Desulfamplus sp.]
MKKKLRYIKCWLIVLQLAMVMFTANAFSFDGEDASAYLWKLINTVRANPMNAVEAYNIDVDQARSALGDEAWILELRKGLPPLAWNHLLAQAASGHGLDMIDRGYYGHTSPEDVSYAQRIIDTGYAPALTGESLGLLSFYVYVDSRKALEDIFENLVRDELNPDIANDRNLFSRKFTEVGISFIPAVFSWDSESFLNIYLMTINYARPETLRHYVMGNIYALPQETPETNSGENVNGHFSGKNGENIENLITPVDILLGDAGWRPENSIQGYGIDTKYLQENSLQEDCLPEHVDQG